MIRFYYPLLLTIAGSGCVINGNKHPRPRDLSPATLVDRVRILGIQAEPPEIRPGESSTISALLIDPSEEIGLTLWVACESAESSSFGCPPNWGAYGGAPHLVLSISPQA